jgi:capsule polysaccharide export protein KpsE/RkpR
MSAATPTPALDASAAARGADTAQGLRNANSSLIDLLQVVVDKLRFLVFGSLGGGLLALAISFLVTPTFTAKTQFIPPKQQQSSAAAALSDLGVLGGGAAGAMAGIKNPADQYAALVKSASIADALADQFKLAERYDEKFKEEVRKQLARNTTVLVGVKDGLISVEVDDEDPQTAADIANAYVSELRKLLNRVALTEAQQRRAFYEDLVAETKADMVRAERALKGSAVSKDELRAMPEDALGGVARLKAQVSAQEVKVAAMRGYLADGAPEFKQALTELAALRAQMARAEQAQEPAANNTDYVARYREFKYQETLYGMYLRQFEMARADESREGAVIQVVDVAQAPERKSKPKRTLITLLATVSTGLLLLIYLFSRNAIHTAGLDPAYEAKLEALRTSWKQAFRRKKTSLQARG